MNSFSDKFSFIPLEAERPKVLVAPPPAGRPLTGFTLIELLVVIGILGTLATAVVLVLNPAQLLAQARDSTRLS
ncbi:MAG: type II secretion system protein, partial [Minisyncoccia bacterium]